MTPIAIKWNWRRVESKKVDWSLDRAFRGCSQLRHALKARVFSAALQRENKISHDKAGCRNAHDVASARIHGWFNFFSGCQGQYGCGG